MIIYGSRATKLAHETLDGLCPDCGAQHSVEIYVFQKYAHVFWLPFFPIGKGIVTQCNQCHQTHKLKKVPDSVYTSTDEFKSKLKIPWWTFSGVGLIIVFAIYGVIQNEMNDQENAKLVLKPQVGDVYEIKTEANTYTLYKVEQVNGDSTFMRFNNYEASQQSGLKELKQQGDTTYSEMIMGIQTSSLKKLLSDGKILDIDRK